MKHAKRKTDKDNYPGLEDFNRFKNEPGSVDGYLQPRPLEALSYILDELRTTNNLAYQMMDRTGDGLALLVSNLCRAAAMQLPGETRIMSMRALIMNVKPHRKQLPKEYADQNIHTSSTLLMMFNNHLKERRANYVTRVTKRYLYVHRLTNMHKAGCKQRTMSFAVAFKISTHAIM